MMDAIKTFSISKHSSLFSVHGDNNSEYIFVENGKTPYHEEPYRAESYAIAYIKEGGVKLNTGLTSWEIDAPTIITLAPSVIRYFSKRSDLLKMDVIFFKSSFLLAHYADHLFLGKYDFFENSNQCVLPLKKLAAIKFNKIYELIQMTHAEDNNRRDEITRSYIFSLVYEIDAYYSKNLAAAQSQTKTYPLSAKFKELLTRNYMHEHKLEFYASQLHITPKALSAAVKKQTGRTAGEWINDSIILEAKVLLQNRSLTVSQISNTLNFSDASVFGKFFRAGTGMSPVAYRKKTN